MEITFLNYEITGCPNRCFYCHSEGASSYGKEYKKIEDVCGNSAGL